MDSYKYLISTTLYLRGEFLSPEEITQRLLVKPTKAFKKGESMVSSSSEIVSVRKIGLWSLEKVGKSDSTSMVSDQLNDILRELERWDSAIIQDCFIEHHYVDIYIAVNCKDVFSGSCTFFLNQNDIELLNKFNFSLNVTVETIQE